MSLYRISGLVQDEKALFRFLLQETEAKQRLSTGEYFLKKITTLRQQLNSQKIPLDQLTIKSQTALLNIEGWSHLLLNREHLFLRIHRSLLRALKEVKPFSGHHVYLRFRASEQISHRMEMHPHAFIFQPSLIVASFPEDYFYHLGISFFSRYAGRPIPPETSRTLIEYEMSRLPVPAPAPPVSTDPYLSELFQKLNKQYFQGKLSQPNLQWSPRRSIRRLGYMNYRKNLLVLSRCLKHPDVPEFVRQGIMYHEMLHLVHRVQARNGKRIHHTRQFKQDEKKFEHHQQLQRWLRTEFPRLSHKLKKC